MPDHRRVEQEQAEAKPSAQIRHAPEGLHPTDARFLQLQRTAGNNAIAGVLAREPVNGSTAPLPMDAIGAAKGTSATPSPQAGSLTLLPQDRASIQNSTLYRISAAFTAFTGACQANLAALKAAAKSQAEAYALVVDIAAGYLAPAFATAAAGSFAGKLAAQVSDSMQVAGNDKAVALITQSDLLKATFTAVSKIDSDQIKRNSAIIFGDTSDDALLRQISTDFQHGGDALAMRMSKMSDLELLSVWAAYDPDYANLGAYTARVKTLLDEFGQYVKVIAELELKGDRAMHDYSTTTLGVRAYRIDAYGKQRIVLVNESEERSLFSSSSRTFRAWVPEMWEKLAIDRTKQAYGAFTDITGTDIDGHLPAP